MKNRYRAWYKKHGKTYDWQWLDTNANIIIDLWTCLEAQSIVSNPEPVMLQYIGRVDRDGEDIVEGDYVQCISKECLFDFGIIYEVKYNYKYCGFEPFCIYDSDCGWYNEPEKFIVVGNKYQNPELKGVAIEP